MLNTDKKDFQFYRGNTLMLRCKCSNVLLGYKKKKPRMTLIRISLETKVKLTKLFLFPRGENHKKLKKMPLQTTCSVSISVAISSILSTFKYV